MDVLTNQLFEYRYMYLVDGGYDIVLVPDPKPTPSLSVSGSDIRAG